MSDKKVFYYEDEKKERLDKYLSRHYSDYSRATVSSWIKSGSVTLNEEIVTQGKKALKKGDHIVVSEFKNSDQKSSILIPENRDLKIAFENEFFCIIDKPANLVVHPGAGVHEGTLVHALAYSHPQTTELANWGLIHRLDKDTSGLLIVAKTETAYYHLNQMMQQREISRSYQALVRGQIRYSRTIETKMARCPHNRLKRAVTQSQWAKNAITHIKVLKQFSKSSHIECQLETGRTHQIRVHCEHIGHPIHGDQIYKGRYNQNRDLINRQALHAYQLRFICPMTEQEIFIQSELPKDFKEALLNLEKDSFTSS